MQSVTLPVELILSTTSELASLSSENVAGVIEGSDPSLKNEYIVFTAHLDHLGQGAAVAGDTIYNGAFDNATGIAVMLEVARYFSELQRKPRRSLLFLAVTAEESGLLGSEYFAKHPTVPSGAIVANINMDTAPGAHGRRGRDRFWSGAQLARRRHHARGARRGHGDQPRPGA